MKLKYKILTILSILIVLIVGIGVTYSFFNSGTTMNSENQGIAKFVFNAEKMDQIEIPLVDLKPGDIKEYLFSISNEDSEITSNVSVQYQMAIKTYHFIPIVIELYQNIDEVDTLILNCDETYSRNNQNELVCNTEIFEMDYSNSILDNYKLKLSFPSEYNDEIYSNLVDYINIEIKSWQKI